MERIALIANEFAHGSIDERPWAGDCTAEQVLGAYSMAIFNLMFLYTRLMKAGADQGPIVDTIAYLILAVLRHDNSRRLQEVLAIALRTEDGEPFPEKVVDLLLGPILDKLRGDLQLVCSSDCERFEKRDSLKHWERRHPIDTYWGRFSRNGATIKPADDSYARLESTTRPCRVGFPVDEVHSCPLYENEISVDGIETYLALATQVLKVRAPRRGA